MNNDVLSSLCQKNLMQEKMLLPVTEDFMPFVSPKNFRFAPLLVVVLTSTAFNSFWVFHTDFIVFHQIAFFNVHCHKTTTLTTSNVTCPQVKHGQH